jgi:hypothetical protein
MAFTAAGQTFTMFGQYGVQTTFYFTSQDPAGTNADLYNGTAWASGDATISKDGGAVANTTNTPAQVTASGFIHSITLTAAEMQANVVIVAIRDATASEVFGPITLLIYNVLTLGQLVLDASQLTNQPGLKATGVGSGAGIQATGGTSGAGVKATGAGSAYGLEVAGASTAFYTNLLKGVPASENVTVPTDIVTYEQQLQALVKRFYNLVTQDSSNQKVYRNDAATVFATMPVSDDGTTQSKGKAS